MGIWNTGSVAIAVWDYVDSMPSYTSGALPNLAERHLPDLQKWAKVSVAANNIGLPYQNYILYATLCDVYNAKDDAGTDNTSVKLGDFSTKKGASSSASELSNKWCGRAERELLRIGLKSGFRQVFG